MDTLVTVQKIFRLRTLIQDSPLSSGDVFVKPTKEPHSVVQSPATELTPQDICISTSWAFPSKPVHSTSESLQQATIPIPKNFLRTLSGYSSSRPRKMLEGSSKGGRHAETRGRASTVTGTIWTEHDTFLPRAKPPPPLKRIKHERNRSENNALPDPIIPTRPSTSHCAGSSESDLTASLLPQRRLDLPTLEISCEDGDKHAAGVQHPLTRATTWTTTTLEASDDTELTFAPNDYDWQPPTTWAGPSKATSADEDDRPKLVGWFTRKKSTDSSKCAGVRIPTGLNRARSFRKLKAVQVAVTEAPKEGGNSATRGGPLPSGVVVKIQCYEGNGWHEKPMADVIPKLRELKFEG